MNIRDRVQMIHCGGYVIVKLQKIFHIPIKSTIRLINY